MTVAFEVPPDFVEQLARRVSEMTTEGQQGAIEPWLNVEEAALYLACDKDRIYDLKSMGRLRWRNDGRRLLFRREWLDEALESPAA
jgi:excisionase family DNA binding protein